MKKGNKGAKHLFKIKENKPFSKKIAKLEGKGKKSTSH
jgi:hypothetical protein